MRIGTDVRKCVVFFGVPDADGIAYGGTGFLVSKQENNIGFLYLVTARHVAEALNKYEDTGYYMRVNLKDGTSDLITVERAVWAFPSDPGVDVAVVPFGFEDYDKIDQQHLSLEDYAADLGKPRQITCGDVISIVGLFRLHHGSKRNVPFVHTGHIAVLPDANEKVPVRNRSSGQIVESEVFLVEAQTLDGISGSPVFVHEVLNLAVGDVPEKEQPRTFGAVKFLGLYQGSWDAEPGTILAKDRALRGQVRVPVGMGVVVPVNKITDLVDNHPDLKRQRQEVMEQGAVATSPVSDSAIPDPRTDANPTQREDFTRLLSAAVRKREPEDRT